MKSADLVGSDSLAQKKIQDHSKLVYLVTH